MDSPEEDFDALLKGSSLGGPGAEQLRERTTLNEARAVRMIAELREQIADDGSNESERVDTARELLRVLRSLGYSSRHVVPEALREAADLAKSVTDSASGAGALLGRGNAREARREQSRGAGSEESSYSRLSRGSATDTSASELVSSEDGPERLRNLVKRAQVVLWDFDGPICRLFAGYSAQGVADDLINWLARRGLRNLVTEAERESLDPQTILGAVARRHPDSDLVAELEERLTHEELRAVPTAWPTPFADPLIRTWAAVGSRLAITTHNSERTVRTYLAGRGLTSCFYPQVYGREQDQHDLKPDPLCLNRALTAMGAAPSRALLIGDSPSGLRAAEQAGVPFLGYARNEQKEKRLREDGAQHVVHSLQTVLEIVRGRA